MTGWAGVSVRGENGYRLYGEEDEARLRQVLLYRGVGVPLQKMPGLMRGEDDAVHAILLRRLYEVGSALFVGCAVGKTPIERTSLHMLPLYGVMVVRLMVVTFVAMISMWLTTLLGMA